MRSPARRRRGAEDLGGREQLIEVGDLHHAGTLGDGAEHVRRADIGAGVGLDRAGSGRMPPRLDHDHRLQARRGAQPAHEVARVADALHVEQDALGLGVQREIVEHVAEVDIGRRAQRDHRRETRCRRPDQSIIAVQIAPDCDTRATLPRGGRSWPTLALSPCCGRIAPMQFGPSTRMRLRRAASTSCS